MRRDLQVRRLPQRVLRRQRFGHRDVHGGAGEHAAVQRRLQRVLVQHLAAAHVGDERRSRGGVARRRLQRCREEREFLLANQLGRARRQRHAQDEVVQPLREKVVQRGFVRAGVPGRGQGAVRVAGAGDDVAVVRARRRGVARAESVRRDLHAERCGDTGDLAADAAVAENTDGLAHVVGRGHECVEAQPFGLFLGFVHQAVLAGCREPGHDDPFGDDGAVDAGGVGDGDAGVGDDGLADQQVEACH